MAPVSDAGRPQDAAASRDDVPPPRDAAFGGLTPGDSLARDAAAWATMPRDPAARRDVPLRTWVEHVMGTAISISVAAPNGATGSEAVAAVAAAFAELRRADEVFSPFRPDSQISRLRDGRTTPDRCDPEVREILALCELLRRASNGYFDAYAAGPGQLDPCGVVKGWAAERAARSSQGVAAGWPQGRLGPPLWAGGPPPWVRNR